MNGRATSRGVILNQLSPSLYPEIKALIESRYSVAVCGYMPKMPDCSLESRHLGLVTAQEIADLQERIERLGEQALQSIDLELLLKIAGDAPPLAEESLPLPEPAQLPLKIGVARDKAFCFYYQDNLELLEELGAQLVPFSPLCDPLPQGLDGLLLGGGYPELYAGELSANEPLRSSLRQVLEQGLPCIAECGGFQYLQQGLEGEDGALYPMVGFLKGKSFRTGRPAPIRVCQPHRAQGQPALQGRGGICRARVPLLGQRGDRRRLCGAKAAAQVALGLRCLRRTFLGRLSPSVFLQQSADGEELFEPM